MHVAPGFFQKESNSAVTGLRKGKRNLMEVPAFHPGKMDFGRQALNDGE
jgi:hypothetical protein